ncbi:MAG TPA: hypothetical protein VFK69_00445, partial [Candidatus Eisenbacteria bacterium]|nr:hypothetical protein [Candidatus Eisenbacteria bacterium]
MRGPASLALCASLVTLVPAVCLAGWNVDGVTVTSTTDNIPLVAACGDGAGGTFVAWQQESAPGAGVLRVQHLTATGDFGYPWPEAGAVACSVSTARTNLVALPDHLGGAYLSWMEGGSLRLTRVLGTGAIAAGWPARGRVVAQASTYSGALPPRACEDSGGGVYLAWVGTSALVSAIHLGPNNTGAGGWPNSPRTVGSIDPTVDFDIWPQVALAGDGGAFIAWGSFTYDSTLEPGNFRLRHVTSSGLNEASWPDEGLDFGVLDPAVLGHAMRASLLALAPDATGGAYMLRGLPSVGADLVNTLFRLAPDGSSAADWPAEGRNVGGPYYYDGSDQGLSYRLHSDGIGGAIAGMPSYASDYGSTMQFQDQRTAGVAWWMETPLTSMIDLDSKGDGGAFAAACIPDGPFNMWAPPASIEVDQVLGSWGYYVEYHPEPAQHWYGDIALAVTGDGEAVFFWSQENQKYGLFARKFSSAGQVTAAPAGSPDPGVLSDVRFERGIGVRATVRLDAGERGRLAL